MEKPNQRGATLFSRLGIGLAAVFLVGFGILLWARGGYNFSPGPVTAATKPGVTLEGFASHAAFEDQCSLCHDPLHGNQNTKCIECHTEIASQIQTHQGTHGLLDPTLQCSSCHTEHKGRDFNPVQDALLTFNHNQTNFPLAGIHGQIACTDCHKNNIYDQARPDCASCHQEPPQHVGMFGVACSNCHNSITWKPASVNGVVFNHDAVGFSLVLHAKDYNGQPIGCTTCHTSSDMKNYNPSTCATCHTQHDPTFMQAHITQYGSSCTTCHDGVDRMHNFSHNTFFVLDGAHSTLDCAQCHANQQFHGTPTACSACHQEPTSHAGSFGLKCDACHTTTAWQPAMLKAHSFPLDHGVTTGQVPCQTCHPSTDATYTCYGCHDHQVDEITQRHARVGITDAALAACESCHLDGLVHPAKTP